MVKTTVVEYEGTNCDDTMQVFSCGDGRRNLMVEKFEKGIATINPRCGDTVDIFTETIGGCLNEDSNFSSLLKKVYNSSDELKGIKFTFSDVTLIATEDNKDKLRDLWNETLKRRNERSCRTKEEVEDEIMEIEKEIKFDFKDDAAQKEWRDLLDKNEESFYGTSILRYARRMGKYMQKYMTSGDEDDLRILFEEATQFCDFEGKYSGVAYNEAVICLAKYWKYGGVLKKLLWPND